MSYAGAFFAPVIRLHRSCLPALKLCVLLAVLIAMTAGSRAQVSDRVSRSVDTSRTTILQGHHPAWANPANSLGPVPADQPMESLTMVLARSQAQEQAFRSFLAEQQNPQSPSYHRWLTPAQVGERYGLSERDIATVKEWLQSEGLHVNWVSPSRTFIGFGGTAENVGHAFHTNLQAYGGKDKPLLSVASDPKIPEALAPVIQSVHGLYTLEDRPMHHATSMLSATPGITSSSGKHFITPADFTTIYDVPTSVTGNGQTIGIVGRARVNPNDIETSATRSIPPSPTRSRLCLQPTVV